MIRDLLDSTNIYGYKILNTLPRSVTNVCNWSMLEVVWWEAGVRAWSSGRNGRWSTSSPGKCEFVHFPPVKSKHQTLMWNAWVFKNKRPMGHIAHLRKQFKSINTYDYIITLIRKEKKNIVNIGSLFEETWIPFTQGCFVPILFEIGSVVLEKRIF